MGNAKQDNQPEPQEEVSDEQLIAFSNQLEDTLRGLADDPDVVVGCVHSVEPMECYDVPGVGLHMSYLEQDGTPVGKVLWVGMPLVALLFAVLRSMESQEFEAAMDRLENTLRGKSAGPEG